MAGRRIKVKAGEDLSPNNIERAIESLDKGSTKKVACDILGIAYNTKRLANIIEGHENKKRFDKEQRAKRRGKPISDEELIGMVEQYLECGSIEQVAKSHWRGTALVKAALSRVGALLKSPKTDYFNPILLPDECVAESFEVGQLVWSARYNCAAEVDGIFSEGVYRLWLLGKEKQFAFQPVEELGSLKHLEELGVNIKRVTLQDI